MQVAWWWFLFAVSVPAAALAFSLAPWPRRQRHRSRRAAFFLPVVSCFTLLAAVAVAWDRTGIAIADVELVGLPRHLARAMATLSAPAVGLAVGAALAAVAAFGRRGRTWIAAAAVAGIAAVALWAADATSVRHGPRGDPEGTRIADVPAVRILEGVDFVVDLSFSRSGDLFFAELYSPRIRVVAAGTSDPADVVTLGGEWERTLHFELHPDWPAVPVLYVARDRTVEKDRLGQVTEVVANGAAAPRVVLEGYPTGPSHPASAFAACDGFLFVTTGDGDEAADESKTGRRVRAQDPGSIEGKVLRYRVTARGIEPAGLLWEDPPVYALGLRNLYGIACVPGGEGVIGGENGFRGHDQVRLVTARSNQEWPLSDLRTAFSRPWFDSGRVSIAPTGVAARATADRIDVFFTAYHANALYQLSVDASGRPGPLVRLHRFDEPALSVELGPGGCAYVGTASAIWRVAIEGCSP